MGSRLDNELTVSVITPLADEYELFKKDRCIIQSGQDGGQVLIRLGDEESLGRELRAYLKTEKYVARKNDGSLPHTTRRILQDRAEENRQRRTRLIDLLERLLLEADYYAAGQALTLKGGSAWGLVNEALQYLIENTFTKLNYLKVLAGNPHQELQAVLRANDIGQQSLILGGEEGNALAANEVRQYIHLSTQASRQIVLQDLIERFARRPYGWPEWDTLLFLARMIVMGEVNLVMDGATLPVERIYDAVITPNKWVRIVVMQRRTVNSGVLQTARKLGKDVLAEMGPDSEDALDAFLRNKLKEREEALRRFKPLADTGDYPGRETIDHHLKLIEGLLAIRESADFIETFIARKNELLDLAEDFHDLEHFYRHQRPAWEGLRQAMGEFRPNRKGLEQDPAAATALKEMEAILKASEPYGLLNKAEGLTQAVREVNERLIRDRRTHALAKIDERIGLLKKDLNAIDAFADLRNACLYPLQRLRKQVEAETSIAHIYTSPERGYGCLR